MGAIPWSRMGLGHPHRMGCLALVARRVEQDADGVRLIGEGIMTKRGLGLALLGGLVVMGACGGKAVIDPFGGGGTGGTTSSSSGTGGSSTSSGTTVTCPDLPSCNWCGGAPVVDDDGCVSGWTCANGVDPCVTSSCEHNGDCQPGTYCGDDGLCWPCEGGPCETGGTSPNLTCSCNGWCENGMDIGFECSIGEWGGNCICLVAGEVVGVCDISGEPEDPCAIGYMCCDWPDTDGN
jgi:hypothetical protein